MHEQVTSRYLIPTEMELLRFARHRTCNMAAGPESGFHGHTASAVSN